MRSRASLLMFGAGTDVGKSVLSAALTRAALSLSDVSCVRYIKPVQTGGPEVDADALRKALSPAQQKLVETHTLFAWDTPVSPHLAVALEGKGVDDEKLRGALEALLRTREEGKFCMDIVETAGGVLSPAPSGTPQADVYKKMDEALLWQMKVVLVGDGRLGGISNTLTCFESILRRGYDVAGVITVEDVNYIRCIRDAEGRESPALDHLGNGDAVRDAILSSIQNGEYSLPRVPSFMSLRPFPPAQVPLDDWFADTSGNVSTFLDALMKDEA